MAEVLKINGLSSAARTADTYGTATPVWRSQELANSTYEGYMACALLVVSQTAGSGNNAGQYFDIHLEGSLDGSTQWTKLAHTSNIQLTTNGVAEYAAQVYGPLMPYVRVAAEIVGTPNATFSVTALACA